MTSRTTNTPDSTEEEEFMVEAVQRFPLLRTLRRRSGEPRELERTLSMSRSTIHRATSSLEEKGLLSRGDEGIELTPLGRTVTDEIEDMRADLDTATRLAPFLNTVEDPDIGIPLELFADADVTHRQPRQAHFGVKRIIDRIEATDSLCMFSTIVSPLYVEVVHREILDGTDVEVIFDAEVSDVILENYRSETTEALSTGRFHLLVGDDIPFELFIYDDGMGMAAHDADGIARAFVETDAPAAVEWAEELYARYEKRSQRIAPGDRLQPAIVDY